MKHLAHRADVVRAAQAMTHRDLSPVRSGNVSVRAPDTPAQFLITPTGADYPSLSPADIVVVAFDGSVIDGQLKPSSEWHMHAAIYRERPEAQAIVHTHSPFATALACTHRGIPPFHYMVAVAGGDNIRCADYATFGTEQLAQNAVTAMSGRRACLLANHGQIAFGETADGALDLAEEVETLAKQYWHVLQIGGPQLLDSEEMARVLKKFETYGQQ